MSSPQPIESPVATYRPPSADLYEPSQREFPGIGRGAYWGGTIALSFVAGIGALASVASLGEGALAPLVLVVLVVGVATAWLVVQRLRNTGWSGWMALLMLVPIFNIYIAVRAAAFPSGYSDHGQIDRAGWIIISVVVSAWLVNLLVAVLSQ